MTETENSMIKELHWQAREVGIFNRTRITHEVLLSRRTSSWTPSVDYITRAISYDGKPLSYIAVENGHRS